MIFLLLEHNIFAIKLGSQVHTIEFLCIGETRKLKGNRAKYINGLRGYERGKE